LDSLAGLGCGFEIGLARGEGLLVSSSQFQHLLSDPLVDLGQLVDQYVFLSEFVLLGLVQFLYFFQLALQGHYLKLIDLTFLQQFAILQ
jgi:hypothetical protein